MRDIAVTAFILGSLPFILKRPQLGVLMYVWISVMNPHRLTWGFAYSLPFAQIVAVTTLVGVLLTREAKWPQLNMLILGLFLFAAWTGVTTATALYPAESYVRWADLMKTLFVVFLIPMLFHRKEDLRLLIWVIVLSIAFFGVKGGIFTIVHGGENRVYGPLNSLIGDNTAIGVAILMTIPLLYYLQLTSPRKFVRWLLLGTILLCGVGALGTYSRGALVAACAIGVFLWWKGRHKIAILAVLLIAVPVGLALMPGKWHDRMETIRDYQAESSANMRLNSWGTMLNLAKDRPVTGGGFELAFQEVYDRYAPDPTFPPQVAHSIYFQALGEHGFVGLALYLWILAGVWLQCRGLVRAAKNRPELAWAGELGRMMQVTLVGFAVGGVFLSLVRLDVPYYFVGVTLVATVLARRETNAQPVVAAQGAVAAAGHSAIRS
jgi:probable O-glycosylation ligase (exosortase A-associated)